MAYVEWNKDKYTVGIDEIDGQHQNLFLILDELYSAFQEEKDNYEFLKSILNKLIQYIIEHFSIEENILEENNYTELENHKKYHDNFKNTIKRYNIILDKSKNNSDNNIEITDDLINFLFEWIDKHILSVDKLYAQFFIEKGIKPI